MHTCIFLSQNGALWDIGLVHCGICAKSLCLALADRYGVSSVNISYQTVPVMMRWRACTLLYVPQWCQCFVIVSACSPLLTNCTSPPNTKVCRVNRHVCTVANSQIPETYNDKTVLSYPYNGSSYTSKMVSLYWTASHNFTNQIAKTLRSTSIRIYHAWKCLVDDI